MKRLWNPTRSAQAGRIAFSRVGYVPIMTGPANCIDNIDGVNPRGRWRMNHSEIIGVGDPT
jgi:hypothetical protein